MPLNDVAINSIPIDDAIFEVDQRGTFQIQPAFIRISGTVGSLGSRDGNLDIEVNNGENWL